MKIINNKRQSHALGKTDYNAYKAYKVMMNKHRQDMNSKLSPFSKTKTFNFAVENITNEKKKQTFSTSNRDRWEDTKNLANKFELKQAKITYTVHLANLI